MSILTDTNLTQVTTARTQRITLTDNKYELCFVCRCNTNEIKKKKNTLYTSLFIILLAYKILLIYVCSFK